VTAIRHLQPEALIVAVSDSLDVQQAMNAIRLGVDVMVRPFDVQEIANLISAKTKGFIRFA
jgi:DNA-binding response OmpR family regulator